MTPSQFCRHLKPFRFAEEFTQFRLSDQIFHDPPQTVSFCRGVYITSKTDSKILKFSVIGFCGMCLHGEVKNRIWRFQTVADPINASCCVSGKLVKTGEWYRSITNAKEWFCSDSILKREFFRDFNLKVYIWFLEGNIRSLNRARGQRNSAYPF